MNLIEQQQKLQNEAEEVLKELQLIEDLNRVGRAELVGSAALGLMTWRDIDIEVSADLDLPGFLGIVSKLIENPRIIDLTLQDTRESTNENMADGWYIGARYALTEADKWDLIKKYKQEAWKIDIWIIGSGHPKLGIENTKKIGDKLTKENRLHILEIKNKLATHPWYRKKIYSVDLYQAILEDGVIDLEGFVKWVKKNKGLELEIH